MNYMEVNATSQLQARLDQNQYDESNLLTIRVPLNMPYVSDWDDFETAYGETELNGAHYTYVKRKVEGGELVLLCIPNKEKTQLQDAKNNFFKLVNDLQQPTGKKDSKDHTVKIPCSDYIANTLDNINVEIYGKRVQQSPYSAVITAIYIATPSQPPEC